MSDRAPHNLREALRQPAESWAREELGLAETAGEDEIRQTVLARLRASNFAPPAAWDQAIRIVAEPNGELRDDDDAGNAFLVPYEGLLHTQMSRFCREFFELPPEARQAAWEKLRAAGAFAPAVAVHLEQLAPALATRLSDKPNPDGHAQWLSDLLCAALRTPPPMRAGIEGLLLAQTQRNPHAWRRAAKQIRKMQPGLAAAVAPLLKEIERQAWIVSGGVRGKLRRTVAAFFNSAFGILILVFLFFLLLGSLDKLNRDRHPLLKVRPPRPTAPPIDLRPWEQRELEADERLQGMLDRDRKENPSSSERQP